MGACVGRRRRKAAALNYACLPLRCSTSLCREGVLRLHEGTVVLRYCGTALAAAGNLQAVAGHATLPECPVAAALPCPTHPCASARHPCLLQSYSPVDNVHAAAYPHMLVLAGLHDPRVGARQLLARWRCMLRAAARASASEQRCRGRATCCREVPLAAAVHAALRVLLCAAGYWEPAKFVAKVRELRTNSNLLLLKCDMGECALEACKTGDTGLGGRQALAAVLQLRPSWQAPRPRPALTCLICMHARLPFPARPAGAGHFSQSGRFDRLKELAVEFAFVLKTLGLMDALLQPSGPAAARAAPKQ